MNCEIKAAKPKLVDSVPNIMKDRDKAAAIADWYKELGEVVSNILLVADDTEKEAYAITRVVAETTRLITAAKVNLFGGEHISSNDALRFIAGWETVEGKIDQLKERIKKSNNIIRSPDDDSRKLIEEVRLFECEEFKDLIVVLNKGQFTYSSVLFRASPDMVGTRGGDTTVIEVKRTGVKTNPEPYKLVWQTEQSKLAKEAISQMAVTLSLVSKSEGRCIHIDNPENNIEISPLLSIKSECIRSFLADLYNIYAEMCKHLGGKPLGTTSGDQTKQMDEGGTNELVVKATHSGLQNPPNIRKRSPEKRSHKEGTKPDKHKRAKPKRL